MNRLRVVIAGIAAAAGSFAALADDGVTIGRHTPGAGGVTALNAHVDLPQPMAIPSSIFPGFSGYATGIYGFSNTPINHPDDDLFMLAPAADVSATLLELGGSLVIHDGLHVMTVGDSMHFGQPFFDYHPLFQIPAGGSGHARFIARDASGTYADSQEFTLFFVAKNTHCLADLGAQGGLQGADGALDNNDFIAFIDLFFGHDARADRGSQGGLHEPDGAFDNNDFVVFIDEFFGGCAS